MFAIKESQLFKKKDTQESLVPSKPNPKTNPQEESTTQIKHKQGTRCIQKDRIIKIGVGILFLYCLIQSIINAINVSTFQEKINNFKTQLEIYQNIFIIDDEVIQITRQTEFINLQNSRRNLDSQKTVINSEGMYINDSNGVQQVIISAAENIEITGPYSQSIKEIIIKDENGIKKVDVDSAGISLYDIPITVYDSSYTQKMQISPAGIEAEDVSIDIKDNDVSILITSELIELKNGNIKLIDTSQLPVITISQSTGLQMFNGLDIQLEEGSIETTGGNIGTEDGNIYSSEGNIYSTLGDIYTEQGTIYTLNGDISAKLGNYYLLDSLDTSIIELTQNEIIMYDSSANELFKLSQTDGFKVTGQDFVVEEGNIYVTEVGGGIFVELTFDDMALMDGTGEYNILLSRSSGIEVFSSKNVAVYGGGVYVRDTSSNNMIEITQTSIILESSSTQYITISRSSGITVDQSLNVKIYGGYVLLQNSAYSKLTQNSLTFFSNGGSSLITISNSVGISLQSSLNLFVDGGNIYVRTDSGSNLIELTQNAIILEDENALVFTSISRTNGIQIFQSKDISTMGGNLYIYSDEGLTKIEVIQTGINLIDGGDVYVSLAHASGINVYMSKDICTTGGAMIVKNALGYDIISANQNALLVEDSTATVHISLSVADGIVISQSLPIVMIGGLISIRNSATEKRIELLQTGLNIVKGSRKFFSFCYTDGFTIHEQLPFNSEDGHIYIRDTVNNLRIDIGPEGMYVLHGGTYYISLLHDSGIKVYNGRNIAIAGGLLEVLDTTSSFTFVQLTQSDALKLRGGLTIQDSSGIDRITLDDTGLYIVNDAVVFMSITHNFGMKFYSSKSMYFYSGSITFDDNHNHYLEINVDEIVFKYCTSPYLSLTRDDGVDIYNGYITLSTDGIIVNGLSDISTKGKIMVMSGSTEVVLLSVSDGVQVMSGGTEIAALHTDGYLVSEIDCVRFEDEITTCPTPLDTYMGDYMTANFQTELDSADSSTLDVDNQISAYLASNPCTCP